MGSFALREKRAGQRIRRCPHVHHRVRRAETGEDDHHAEAIAEAAPCVEVPVVRGRVVVRFGERDGVAAAQGRVFVLDAEDACEGGREVGEDADEHVTRHVLLLRL